MKKVYLLILLGTLILVIVTACLLLWPTGVKAVKSEWKATVVKVEDKDYLLIDGSALWNPTKKRCISIRRSRENPESLECFLSEAYVTNLSSGLLLARFPVMMPLKEGEGPRPTK